MNAAPSVTGFTPFRRVALIGIGLIGSSLAHILRRERLAEAIVAADINPEFRTQAMALGIVDEIHADPTIAVAGADLVILCTPIGTYAAIGTAIAPHLAEGAIVSDVGSVKGTAIRDLEPTLPDHVQLVPGHPISGTEHSGPEAGFAELFEGRWAILTPVARTSPEALARVRALWEAMGSRVAVMDPTHHDRVLAITSHLPHLIAYTIVGTATDLEEHLKAEVIKYSAGGFRDFTRIAASDPIMWRDVFLNNGEAVLEMVGRLQEDLAVLQRAIRNQDGATLEAHFTRTRAIRRGIIAAKQA